MKNLFVCLLVAFMSQTVAFAQTKEEQSQADELFMKAWSKAQGNPDYWALNEALQLVNQAIKLAPNHAYYAKKAEILDKSDEVKEAITAMDEAIRLKLAEPQGKTAGDFIILINYHTTRGDLHLKVSNQTSAIRDYSKVIDYCASVKQLKEIDKNTIESAIIGEGYAYLSRAKTKYAQGDKKGAFEDAVSATKAKAMVWENHAWHLIGKIKIDEDNYQQAINAINNAINSSWGELLGNLYMDRGFAYHKLGNKAQACADLKQAGELGVKKASQFMKEFCE